MTAPIAKPWLFSQPDQDPRTATGARLRWGVIATGGIAAAVTRDLELLADAELYAVSSRTQAAADAFAADYGFARAYGDQDGATGYDRLLADDAVDVVYVATPHAHHHEIALAALNAGKHVLCEKALTVNAREAAELIAVARANGLFLMEAVWSRFLPSMQRAFEIAASGEIGDGQVGRRGPRLPGALLPHLPALGAEGRRRRAAGPDGLPAALGPRHPGFPADGQRHRLAERRRRGRPERADAGLPPRRPGPADLVPARPRPAHRHGRRQPGLPADLGSINNPKELLVRIGFDEPRSGAVRRWSGGATRYELREVTRCIQQGLTESPVMPLEDSLNTMRLFDGVRAQLGVSYPNDAH